jgi:heme exporter protein CcmD
MERYAFYLVGAYGVFALAIAIEVARVRVRLARARRKLGTNAASSAQGTPR